MNEPEKSESKSRNALYLSRISILMALYFLGYLISATGGIKLGNQIYGLHIDINNIAGFLMNPTHPDFLLFLQNITALLSYLLPALVIAQMHAGTRKYDFLKIQWTKISIGIGLILILASILLNPAIELVYKLSEMIDLLSTSAERKNQIDSMTQILLSGNTTRDLLLNIINVALIPAIAEEFFFRGAFQNLLYEWTKKIGISLLITSSFFSLLHSDPSLFIPRMMAGLILGFIYISTRSIWISIAVHSIFNGSVVVIKYLENTHVLPINWVEGYIWSAGVSGMVIIPVVLYIIHYNLRKKYV